MFARPFLNTTPGQPGTLVPFVSEPIIPIDSIVSGSFTFGIESDAIGNSTGSGVSYQVNPNVIESFQFEVHRATYSNASPVTASVSSNQLGPDKLVIRAGLTGPLMGEFAPLSAQLIFVNDPETASWSIEPPMDSNSESFDFGVLTATWSGDTSIGTMSALLYSVDLAVISVPEPSSFAPLTTMFLCLTRRRIVKLHE